MDEGEVWAWLAARTQAITVGLKGPDRVAFVGRSHVVLIVRRLLRMGRVDWRRVRDLVERLQLAPEAARAAEAEVWELSKRIPEAPAMEPVMRVWRAKPDPEPREVVIVRQREFVPVLSFDASCSPLTQSCGAAYVLKEYREGAWRVLAMKSIALPNVGNAAAEAEACLAGLRMAAELGVRRLDVVGDCQAALDAVNGEGRRGGVHLAIRRAARAFQHVQGVYCGREANGLADALASEATHTRGGAAEDLPDNFGS